MRLGGAVGQLQQGWQAKSASPYSPLLLHWGSRCTSSCLYPGVPVREPLPRYSRPCRPVCSQTPEGSLSQSVRPGSSLDDEAAKVSTASNGAAEPSPQEPASPSNANKPTAARPKTSTGFMGLLPPATSLQLLASTAQLLKRNFWAIVLLYMLKDGAAFVLHRASQRLTNIGAVGRAMKVRMVACVCTPMLSAAVSDSLLNTSITSTANPWWLYLESSFLEANPGYQVLIVLFFLLALPLNILVSSAAATAAAQLCVPPPEQAAITAAVHMAQLKAERAKAVEQGIAGNTVEDMSVPKPEGDDLLTLALRRQSQQGASTSAPSSGPSQSAAGTLPSSGAVEAGSSTDSTSARTENSNGTGSSVGSKDGEGEGGGTKQGKGIWRRLTEAVSDVKATLPPVKLAMKRVWWVDILFNLRALPLQALSLLVLPVPWTVPRLLAIQLAVPASILEGRSGTAALQRSSQLMAAGKDLMTAYGWPFVALILAVRVLDGLRNVVLTAIPVRWWQDVVEVPLLITAAFAFAKLLVIRLQDLLPLAAYLMAQRRESGQGQNAGSSASSSQAVPATAIPTI